MLPPDNPKDDRIGFTGKDGFPAGFFDILRRDTGPFDIQVTVAVGPDGLKDGASSGFFGGTAGVLRLDRPPFDEATSTNAVSTLLTATWDEAAKGFMVTGEDNGSGPLGFPRIVPNTYQVDLRMQQTATTFSLFTRPTPADHGSPDGWITTFSTALPVPATPFSFGFVGRGLDQKATVVFDFFRLTGPNIGGATERPLANQIGSDVINPIIDARDAVRAVSPDLAAPATALQLAADGAATVQAAITAAQTAGTLQPSTEAALALKALGKVSKTVLAAKKAAAKGDVKKAAAIEKSTVAAGGSATVAIADLFGFSAKSIKDIPLGTPR